MRVAMTNTAGIIFLIVNAAGRNRCVEEEQFTKVVDPNGRHIMAQCFSHNDSMRTQWLCKVKGTDTPIEIWLDVDTSALDECITVLEVPDEE